MRAETEPAWLGRTAIGQRTGVTSEVADTFRRSKDNIGLRQATVTICGMSYVGLPLASAIVQAGFAVTGTDTDRDRGEQLRAGKSYISHIPSTQIEDITETQRFRATSEFAGAAGVDIVICIPTPLTPQPEPDLSHVVAPARATAGHVDPGQLIVIGSTTYPETAVELLAPIFAERGLAPGRDILLAYSPERVDPGKATLDLVEGIPDGARRHPAPSSWPEQRIAPRGRPFEEPV